MSTSKYPYRGTGFQSRMGKPTTYSKAFLTAQLRSMIRIRMIELEIERLYPEDQIKTPVHLVIGQEATSVGACAAMNLTDQIWTSHRTHGAYLAKGGDLKAAMCEMYCRVNGCAGSRGGSMHLIDKKAGVAGTSAIVGAILPIATGAALAAQLQKKDIVNTVFFGDAALEEGVSSESLNFAALRKLPLVFFCENNFYSVCTPLHARQPESVELWKRAGAFGMPSVKIDGSNVLDVFEATKEAVERARSGGGPTFIEAQVCRYRAHGGAGDDSHTGYRMLEEVQDWLTHADPVEGLEKYMESLGFFNKSDRAKIETELTAEIKEAFDFAINSPNPVVADLYRHVYSD